MPVPPAASALGKLNLALGKGHAISVTLLGLSLGTALLVVVAGSLLVAQLRNSKILDSDTLGKKKTTTG